MNLRELKPGESAIITAVGGKGSLRQLFLDMGVIPGVEITLMKYAPMGDPMELRLHGYELTLRLADAEQIDVTKVSEADTAARVPPAIVHYEDHPGLGEGGRYHVKADEHPLPEGTVLTFALAGNQNCGKTTLFNQLTGANQHVGNFPGVTVERKTGAIRGFSNTQVTDLPGIYSLSPYTAEEIVSRQFILEEKPTGIINIVDATNIERNLYLTLQLMELNVPIVLALNMMDEVRGNGGSIRVNEMERLLGIPVVPSPRARARASTSWWGTRYISRSIRSGPAAPTSATRRSTAARSTAACTASCTSSQTTPRTPGSPSALPPASSWRAISW
jgi:ferrous iron transport protein B